MPYKLIFNPITGQLDYVNTSTGGGAPSGPAGGVLAGSYPSPTINASVALTGVPTVSSTPSQNDNSLKIADTAYVDLAVSNAIAGVNPAVSVSAATTQASDTSSYTYNNGASGIGATLTGVVNTALVVDGFTFTAVGQSLLVKNDTQAPSGAFNGTYNVTQIQTGILPLILTRRLDYDQPSDINNTGAIPVVNGTVNGSSSWLLTSNIVTVGTSPLTFASFVLNPSTVCTLNPTASLTIVGGGGTSTVNANSRTFSNFYASSNATSTVMAFSGIPDGGTATIDYLKTTATDLLMAFPGGTVINISSSASVSGTNATLTSTASGRYTITIVNINSVYKVFIVQDVL
jgi:hypothetical protein